eukprot:TRINITY_DN35032_c0_g1_i1.p3 TRINITY_DN35032_c0_g1~~TRINITY_DN35032_c0_g1_i1.p3  ORF type:complete len:171 (-),score=14.15 TRINITY_DN35032_c0_g1_i1:146-658(-)
MNNQLQTYKKVNINTMNRGKIVVMLYGGGITFLKKAKKAINEKDYYQKGKFIQKALDIVNELNISLDMEKGEDVAKNLRQIYLFLNRYLNKASIKNDPKMLDDVIEIFTSLKSAFEEIISRPEYSEAQLINKKEQAQNAVRRYVQTLCRQRRRQNDNKQNISSVFSKPKA